jgi:protein dithiol oxidoreductase (disulfide-forming)
MGMIMGKMQQFFLTLLLAAVSVNVNAGVGNPELGKEYRVLQKAQPVDAGKKIEIIEFFAYYCPHCSALEPLMTDWVKKQGDRILSEFMYQYQVWKPSQSCITHWRRWVK